MKAIEVNYKTYSTIYSIKRVLEEIESKYTVVSFDIETRSIYSKEQRDKAKTILTSVDNLDNRRRK